MAHWGFTPQGVLTETLTTRTRIGGVSPMSEWRYPQAQDVIRAFRLAYSVVTSTEATSMAAFFVARRGSYEPFTFVSPNDAHAYLVRFADDLTLEHFTPGYLRTGAVTLLVVTS